MSLRKITLAKRVTTAYSHTVTTATIVTIRKLPGRLPFHLIELVTMYCGRILTKHFLYADIDVEYTAAAVSGEMTLARALKIISPLIAAIPLNFWPHLNSFPYLIS
jgi:hypothetical protein